MLVLLVIVAERECQQTCNCGYAPGSCSKPTPHPLLYSQLQWVLEKRLFVKLQRGIYAAPLSAWERCLDLIYCGFATARAESGSNRAVV